jgi:hypothetical protein
MAPQSGVKSAIASRTSDQDAISSSWHEPTIRAFQLIVTGVLGESVCSAGFLNCSN